MAQVADFSSPQDLNAVARHFAGIVRYVSDYHPKNITHTEFTQAIALHLTVTLVCEQGTQPATRGAAGGEHDALVANAQADEVGYDPSATIYFVAEDPTVLPQSSWGAVESYFGSVRGTSKRPIGAYGGLKLTTNLMSKGLVTKKWCVQTWGGTDSATHLEQLVGAPTYGLAIDANQVLQSDYGQHPRTGPGPSPTGGEEGNMIATDPTSGGFWATDPSGDTANYNGAPMIPGLNTHPDWHAGANESGGQNKVVGLATFKDKNGKWGIVFQTAPAAGATDQSQYSYYRLARDGSPD